jgi:four helix bundle protein
MAIVEEEADESSYWFELLIEGGFVPQERLTALLDEADQLVAMTVSSVNTAKQRQRGQR